MILHHNMPRFLAGPHQVKDAGLWSEVEVHIDFRAPHMRVRRHRVPRASGVQMRDAHHQLAAFGAVEEDILANGSLVACIGGA